MLETILLTFTLGKGGHVPHSSSFTCHGHWLCWGTL